MSLQQHDQSGPDEHALSPPAQLEPVHGAHPQLPGGGGLGTTHGMVDHQHPHEDLGL